jgi:cation diffusion facilitator CzcD-associated flavoprotein CzcO
MAGTPRAADTGDKPGRVAVRRKDSLRIGIVGAGFAGIGLAARLRRAGFTNVVLFERGDRPGGTWRDNTYPGAACDVPSHLYSYSFAPKYDWQSRYSGQPEILSYIEGVARQFGVTPAIRFGRAVTRAVFDERDATWEIETSGGRREIVDVFVPAVGQLSLPSIPACAGLDTFRGVRFHSARWDHSVPVEDRRIAVIGSAASAVQIVPELAKSAARLFVFQRTPNWVIPRFDWRYSRLRKALFRYLPGYRAMTRASIYLSQEALFRALRTGTVANRLMKQLALWHLGCQVADPTLRAKLTPDYTFGCKRVLLSDDYFPSFSRPNVELVTDPIAGFDAAGIRTADGKRRDVDVAVFATGFDVRNCLRPVAIVGRGGLDLQQRWSAGPEAFRGITVPDFPNMFILYGPNTNLGHNSILFMFECQFAYIVNCLRRLVSRNLRTLEVRPEVSARFNATLRHELAGTVWTTGCGNWYGQAGRITANWSGSTLRYWWETRQVDFRDFVEHRDAAEAPPALPGHRHHPVAAGTNGPAQSAATSDTGSLRPARRRQHEGGDDQDGE